MVGKTIAVLAATGCLVLVAAVYLSQRHTAGHLERLRHLSARSAPLAELEAHQASLVRALEASATCGDENQRLTVSRDASATRLAQRDPALAKELIGSADGGPCELASQRLAWSRIVAQGRLNRLESAMELRCASAAHRPLPMLSLATAGFFAFTLAFLGVLRSREPTAT